MSTVSLGFAVNLDIILKNQSIAVNMNSQPGYLESDFLSQIANSKKELEPKADNCMKVSVRCVQVVSYWYIAFSVGIRMAHTNASSIIVMLKRERPCIIRRGS